VNGADAIAILPFASADELRRALRSSERVVFAAVPLAAVDSGEPGWGSARWLLPFFIVAGSALLVASVLLSVFGEEPWHDTLFRVMLSASMLAWAIRRTASVRAQRRIAASSVTAVTDQRVILLSTAPQRTVLSIEGRDIDEVYCRMVSPKCGHVRFAGGVASSQANALMYVPNPHACEAAMRALQARSKGS
jgi:hypothetical protein